MFKLDRLRTAYVSLPLWLRGLVAPLLSLAPASLRFGSTYTQLRKDIDRSRTNADFVAAWQAEKLRTLLHTASNQSPYYGRLAQGLTAEGVEFAEIRPKDLSALPILTKETVRSAGLDLLTCPPHELDVVSTSGSSGTPLTFYLPKNRSTKEWAFVQDSWQAVGFSPDKERAVFRGVQIAHVDERPWEHETALKELRLSPFHMIDKWMAQYCDLIVEGKIRFLQGYPSALAIFGGYVLRVGRQDVQKLIDGVICSSEALHSSQRLLLQEAFKTEKVLSFYGMSEKVAFATEVLGAPGTFEMEPLYGITELVDDDGKKLESPGDTGRVIATGLLFTGLPFIRYDTGDVATLVENPTAKNCYRMKLKGMSSRRGQEFLVGNDGQLISMTAINIHSAAYDKMSAFQFVQHKRGEATLRAVLASGAEPEDLEPFINEISTKIGHSMSFGIEIVDGLPQNTRGKTKFIEQSLNLSDYGRGRN